MQYKVTIDQFEGPLDLLLHLIKEQNIDIYDIKIKEITKQYLEYIHKMKEMNLSVASEYLVMASELIEMKSKMLLPSKNDKQQDEYEEDPKEVLIQRLLNYKQYKEVTSDFKKLEQTRKLVYTKQPVNLSYYAKEEDAKENLDINDLIEAFNYLIKKKLNDKPLATKVTKKELSVTEKVLKIRSILRKRKHVNFEELFEVATKEEIIVSFLSILEMVKKDEIVIKQENNFNQIIISLKGCE